MSGYTDDDLTRRGLLEAGAPYLEKPFSPQDLARMVADVLRSLPARPSMTM
jgi:DNA-binding response OmpR family regulator